jgi:hypothetical protein
VAHFEALWQNLPEGTEEEHESESQWRSAD